MKQIISLTGILLISATLSAQKSRVEQQYLKHFKKHGTVKALENENALEARSVSTAAKQRLDSIVSARSRTAYTYDANGNVTSEGGDTWDTITSQWTHEYKIESTFNASGYGTSFAKYYWDEVLNQWAGANKFNWNRDADGEVIMYTLSTVWDAGSGQFIPGIKYENIRDQNGNRTSYTKYQWDTDSSKYLLSEKGDLTYDADGNRTSFTKYQWEQTTSEWILSYKEEFSFDANGNRTSFTSLFWDMDSSKWMGNYKLEHTFDAGDNNTLTVRYEWDGITSLWIPVSKQESAFDDNGYVTLQSESIWSADSGMWIMQGKYERTYDENGFNTLSVSYGWDDMLDQIVAWKRWESIPDSYGNTQTSIISVWDIGKNDWVERDKTEYSFDYTYTRQDLMTPLYGAYKITRRIDYMFENDELKSGEWKIINDFTYHYSDLAVNVADISLVELSLYPNPATDYIQVEGDEFSGDTRIMMYNVSGKMVLNQVLDNGGRIPVSHLSEGIYVIRLVQGDKVKTGKVMIE